MTGETASAEETGVSEYRHRGTQWLGTSGAARRDALVRLHTLSCASPSNAGTDDMERAGWKGYTRVDGSAALVGGLDARRVRDTMTPDPPTRANETRLATTCSSAYFLAVFVNDL